MPRSSAGHRSSRPPTSRSISSPRPAAACIPARCVLEAPRPRIPPLRAPAGRTRKNHRECGAPDRGNDMFRLSRRCLLALLAFTVPPAHTPALAQSYPSRPVTIIVPLAAGTGMDTLARLYGDQLSHALGKPVVIENKPGAGLMLGTAAIASAPP